MFARGDFYPLANIRNYEGIIPTPGYPVPGALAVFFVVLAVRTSLALPAKKTCLLASAEYPV